MPNTWKDGLIKGFSAFREVKARISIRCADEDEVELTITIEPDGGNHLRIVRGKHEQAFVIEAVVDLKSAT
jgi:hypothetical protein